MALVALKGIGKEIAGKPLLAGVDLVVNEGERIGLVGRNGVGKTTLLRILGGFDEPDRGERLVRKGLRIGCLEQEPVLDPGLSARETVGAADEEPHRVAALLDRLGLADPDAPCGRLSGGEQRRVALARALRGEPDLLLLDEPTNHLDAFVTSWLERFLGDLRVPLVMVTHDRYFLDRIATRIVELDRGELFSSEGGYRVFLERRAARLEAERRAESSRLNLLRRESDWIRRGPQGRGTKARARVRRYEELVEAARAKAPEELSLSIPPGPALGTKVVHLRGVSRGTLFQELDLVVERDDRIGIVGPNGAGKTTLLRVLMQLWEPDAGKVDVGETVTFSYVDQERTDLDPGETVLQAVSGGNSSVKVGDQWVRVESFLGAFLFPKGMFRVPVGMLSGGERNRVLLAKLLLQGGNVIVLDEPTNDLDLETLRALEEALLDFPGAVLVVSHDRWFLDRVANRILCLDGTGNVREWPGAVDDLLETIEQERRAAPREKAPKPRPRRRAEARKLSYHEQRELDALPERIHELECELALLDERLADPGTYQRPDVAEITARRSEVAARIAALYARWEDLEQRN